MTGRWPEAGAALLGIVLVTAQDVWPATALYHTWQYALTLAVTLAVLAAAANAARRRGAPPAARRFVVALAGAAVIVVAGLASGLLGPDTASIVGTPGTVTPVPALGAAAFFSAVDRAALERGAASVTVRRRDAAPIELSRGARRLIGEALLYLEPRPAAYVETFDEAGRHLTVTQPTNASFLSPILLFRDRQRIAEFDLPFDTFSSPAKHRIVRALYITPAQLAHFGRAVPVSGAPAPAVILTVADDRGTSLGIRLARSGEIAQLGGIRIRVTIGSYPALEIASVPETWALIAGGALFVAGLGWNAAAARQRG